MDIPRYLAEVIYEMSGRMRVEIEPSPGDIKTDHFIVSVENFWDEPGGTFQNITAGDYSFEESGVSVEGFDQSLPVRVVWRSNCIGQHWRATVIEQTRKNALMFSAPFFIPVFGGKLTGTAADMVNDGVGGDIANFEENNIDGPGLGMIAILQRDPGKDIVFAKTQKNDLRNGYIAEQHFVGGVFFQGGAEVPNDKRRNV